MAKRHALAILFYLLISIFFLKGVLFSPGIIIGADWSLPLTKPQAEAFGNHDLYTWTNIQNAFGTRLPHLNTYPFNLTVSLLSKLGVGGEVFSKLWLLSLFTLIGFSAYYFCRRTKLSFKASLLAGFVYLTTPLVFNYSIIGWDYVLLAMGIMPLFILAFKLSVENGGGIKYAVIAGLLFALAICQSQVIVWFPLLILISLPFLVRTRRQFFIFVRSALIIALIAFLLHLNWLLPLLIVPDPQVSQAIPHFDTRRFEMRLNFLNMIRLRGSLFNYQFETAYPDILLPVSFILPALSLVAVFLKKKSKDGWYLLCVAALPLVIYALREIIRPLPFSMLVRDFGRLMMLASFPYAVLAGIAFERIGGLKKIRGRRGVGGIGRGVVVVLLLLNAWPFWAGELWGKATVTYDQRLRVLDFSKTYEQAEKVLLEDITDTKALYLPGGQLLNYLDNKDFSGSFQEIGDIFAQFSKKPGIFAFPPRASGEMVDFGKVLLDSVGEDLLSLTSINSLVVRENTSGTGGAGLEVRGVVESLPGVVSVFDRPGKISVFKNERFAPHFYIPTRSIFLDGDLEGWVDVLGFRQGNEDLRERLGVYSEAEMLEKADEVFVVGDWVDIDGNVGFRVRVPEDGEYQVFTDWVLYEEGRFETGEEEFRLDMLVPVNMVGEVFPAAGGALCSELAGWVGGKAYKTSFNYRVAGKGVDRESIPLEVFVFEEGGGKVSQRAMFTGTSGEWQEFSGTVTASTSGTGSAGICFKGLGKGIEVKNVEVVEKLEMRMLLTKKQGSKETRKQEELRDSPLPRTIPNIPQITFVRVNPTKYKVKVEGATDPYTLIFNESFHPSWRIYLGDGGDRGDGYGKEVASYFNGDIKEGTHRDTFLESATFETFNLSPIQADHLIVNGYANSWYIEPDDVGGEEDYELIVEFEPQKWMYIGLFVSVLTLGGCIGYLGLSKLKRY